jgi:hypothetical protein
MEMEKPFFCLTEECVGFLNFTGSFKDIFGSFEKTIYFGFLSPFPETLYVAFVMLDPVYNQIRKVFVTEFFSNSCPSCLNICDSWYKCPLDIIKNFIMLNRKGRQMDKKIENR